MNGRLPGFVAGVLIWAAVAGPLSAGDLPSIAVADFAARGVEEHEAIIIAERFRGHLVESGLFKVMERSQMETILKEQGFQQSGACTEATCVIEIGQLLAVEKMLVGSVGKIGQMYTLNVKLIDIKTGEILLSRNEDVKGSVENVLIQAVPSLSEKVVQEATALDIQVGYLNVTSEPAGATVSLGEEKLGTTPVSAVEVPAGQHQLAVSLRDYTSQERTITVAKGATVDLSFTLSPTEEYLASRKEEAAGRRARLKNIFRWGSAGVAVLGLGAAGYLHMQWSQKDADYWNATTPDQARSLHEEIEDIQTYRTAALVVGVLGAVGMGVTFVF